MPQPEEVALLTVALRNAYDLASAWIDEQEASILHDPRQWRERARLVRLRREVNERMASLDSDARAFFGSNFPRAYEMGASAVDPLGFAFGGIDTDAVAVLARDGLEDLLSATEHVREDVKRLIRRLTKERALLSLTTGRTPTQAARDLSRLLDQYGIRAVRYANGARHRIGDYADMVLRTVTAEAYQLGGVNQMRRMGIRYVEVFDGTADLPCAAVANTIQTIEWAAANLLGHPRCQRSTSPRPDITDPETAERTTTLLQRFDQSAIDQARADAARRRAALRRQRLRALR